MANSYLLFTGNGSTTQFSLVGIDGWVNSGFLKVYLNDVLQTTGYSFVDMNTATPKVQFVTAPANTVIVKVQRETPTTVSGFKSNIVDFNDGSILTAGDLDRAVEALVHIAQESNDTGSGAIGLNTAQTNWDAESKRLTNMDDGVDAQDAVTMAQLTTATLYGGATVTPQVWAMTATGSATYTLSPAPLSTTPEMFLVEVGGVIQHPSVYTITSTAIVFNTVVANGIAINVRNLGVARNINESVTSAMLQNDSVTAAKIASGAVGSSELATDAVQTVKVADDAITYAKIQNVTASDRLLGRSSAGAGDVEEIVCTGAARALLDDATNAAQRTTLGLGGLAVKTTVADVDVDAAAQIALSKLATLAANTVIGCGAVSATPTALPCTAAGRSMIAAADAAAQRTLLGVFTFQNGGSNIGSVVPLASTTAPAPGSTTLQTLNASINAGTWLCVILAHGGAGAFDPAKVSAGVIAYNANVSTIPNVGGVLASGQNWGGFAVRVS